MATLYIEEFEAMGVDPLGQHWMPLGAQPSVTSQTVAIGGTSAASSAFNAKTKYVRLQSDAVCSYKFGTAPTATTSSPRMASGSAEYFWVAPGQKVAVISNT